jgi:very-short-patch-repair endonuclease
LIPLEENPSHLKAKNLICGTMEELGYNTHQEYPFTTVLFFGYSPKQLWQHVREIQFMRGQRYIGKGLDVSTYTHHIDVYAERVTNSGIREKIALEIDGKYHEELKQERNDKVFEAMWEIWIEDPKEIFRIKKEHVLQMPRLLLIPFAKYILKGDYTLLLEEQKDKTIDISKLIEILSVQ